MLFLSDHIFLSFNQMLENYFKDNDGSETASDIYPIYIYLQ